MRELHRIIVERTDPTRGLISDLLDTGRIDSGTLPVSPEPAAVADLGPDLRTHARRKLGDSAENPAGLFNLRGVRWDGRLARTPAGG